MPNVATGSRSVGGIIEKGACYSTNLAELLAEGADEFIDSDGKFLKFDFSLAVKLINVFWAKIKETILECEGKEVEIKFPTGPIGVIISTLLAALGIRI